MPCRHQRFAEHRCDDLEALKSKRPDTVPPRIVFICDEYGNRVCLRTASSTQSRMTLEQDGAELLLGHGELLFRRAGELVR